MTGGTSESGTRRWRGAAGLVLIVTCGLLSACTKDDEPIPPPPTRTTAAPTPTPSPSATPPTAPEAKPTPASAEAFVRYFWEVYNYSYQTLDTAPLKSISSKPCKFCETTLNEVTDLKSSRKKTVGGEIHPLTVVAPPGDLSKGVIVTLVLDQDSGQTLKADGTVSSTSPPVHNMRSEIALSWRESHWLIYGVANDEKTGTK